MAANFSMCGEFVAIVVSVRHAFICNRLSFTKNIDFRTRLGQMVSWSVIFHGMFFVYE